VTAAQSERERDIPGRGVDVAAGGQDDPLVRDDEGPVELGQLLDRLAQVGVVDVALALRMPHQGVKDETAGVRHDGLGVGDDEHRPHLPALAPLPRDLHGQEDDLLQRLVVDPAGIRENVLEKVARRRGQSLSM